MRSGALSITVVVPTYNGAHKIMGVLRSLEQQSRMPDEVLVVIDGSTDGTEELLQKSKFSFPNFRIIIQPNKGRAAVRNRGAQEASGDLLIFLDDDMLADEHLVAYHERAHGTQKKIVTGRLEDVPRKSPTDFEQFRQQLTQKWNESLATETGVHQLSHPYLTAGNLSMFKQSLLDLGGFDERLNDAEDYDLATRALAAGIPLYYSTDALALHNDNQNITCAQYIRRQIQYQKAHSLLVSLKPDLYGSQTAYSTVRPTGIKGKIFKVLQSDVWPRLVDKEKLGFLPRPIRYKIYDLIVTANSYVN